MGRVVADTFHDQRSQQKGDDPLLQLAPREDWQERTNQCLGSSELLSASGGTFKVPSDELLSH